MFVKYAGAFMDSWDVLLTISCLLIMFVSDFIS